MKPYPKIRKTIKWSGAAVTLLLVMAWIGNAWGRWYLGYSASGWDATLSGGRISLSTYDHPTPGTPYSYLRIKGWMAGRWTIYHGPDWRCLFERTPQGTDVSVPLWIPVALALATAVTAWGFDGLARRRRRAARLNLCPKCNYNRAGIGGGMSCPECGSAPT